MNTGAMGTGWVHEGADTWSSKAEARIEYMYVYKSAEDPATYAPGFS